MTALNLCLRPGGGLCTDDGQCPSLSCQGGVCECRVPTSPPQACNHDAECCTGLCLNDTCYGVCAGEGDDCSSSGYACCAGYTCDQTSAQCGVAIGFACDTSLPCANPEVGIACLDGVCSEANCNQVYQSCAATGTCCPGLTCQSGPNGTCCADMGTSCSADTDCCTNVCHNGLCDCVGPGDSCANGQCCSLICIDGDGICQCGPQGTYCRDSSDCCSNVCDEGECD